MQKVSKEESAGAPSFQIGDDWISPAADNGPLDFFVTIIGLLMLDIGGDQCKVASGEILTRKATIAHDGSVASNGKDDCVSSEVSGELAEQGAHCVLSLPW